MKKLLLIVIIGVGLTSCTKDEFELESNYQFEMTGRTTQDVNGYYHIAIDGRNHIVCVWYINCFHGNWWGINAMAKRYN